MILSISEQRRAALVELDHPDRVRPPALTIKKSGQSHKHVVDGSHACFAISLKFHFWRLVLETMVSIQTGRLHSRLRTACRAY